MADEANWQDEAEVQATEVIRHISLLQVEPGDLVVVHLGDVNYPEAVAHFMDGALPEGVKVMVFTDPRQRVEVIRKHEAP
jgi:hypothetical protein